MTEDTEHIFNIRQFIDSEFRRIDSEHCRNNVSFTFNLNHVLRGTTAVWGRSMKTKIPSHLKTPYRHSLNDLVKNKERIDGYSFEKLKSGNKIIFRVTRCSPQQHCK